MPPTTSTTTTEPTMLPTSSAPTATGTTPSCTPSGGTKRNKKIILVDPKRKEANKAFLQSVRDAGLRHRNGEPRHIRVYDWRVLEELKEEEKRCGKSGRECDEIKLDMRRSGSIWRRYWVGLT
ncbi:hypothetical protein SMACR_04051 [Sordaria macrospora]|uniref:WGS project CABT00000000 data, contig 2.17 n=3 Tax=Sordaria macrospora TaxID=5147 RepID=F7W0P7_SORMK|nr:uncharacterized protein SMAC_04051 [Sordaria macrospora k-hell]KAA8633576.1 hypothetical protein SMACR_04051 [Sordaria macrospora]CCC11348.1 unnamed protein product [Sordaria macrospora k-hell]